LATFSWARKKSFVHGCTYAAGAWMRWSSDTPSGGKGDKRKDNTDLMN
jgi:hypothetical protein